MRPSLRPGRRSTLGVLAVVVPLAGCTELLGIDGNYGVLGGADGGEALVAASGGAASVDTSSGGAVSGDGTGGTSGASGAGDAGAAGASVVDMDGGQGASDSGIPTGCPGTGCPTSEITPCTTGSYTGELTGQHAALITFVGVPFDVMADLLLHVVGTDGSTTASVTGQIENGAIQLAAGGGPTTPFDGTLTGKVDCATGALTLDSTGGFSFSANSTSKLTTFSGTQVGKFSKGTFSGTWEEEEANAPASPPPPVGNLPALGRGKGPWSATRVPTP